MHRITVGTVNIDEETIKKIEGCLRSQRISQGVYVSEFETEFAKFHDIKECVAVGTGTAAGTLALASLQDWTTNKDKEVILPALTFISCANSVLHSGFKPVFVDVDMTYQIRPGLAEKAVNNNTIAMMPVHLFGRPAPMDEILDIKSRKELTIIEDASEAHGARYKNRLVGTFGDMATYSFYVAHIVTSGEGGAVLTNNEGTATIIRSLRSHGRACACKKCVMNISSGYCPIRFKDENFDKRFYFERVGYSEKMNEIEALIGCAQIKNLQKIVNKRRKNLEFLIDELSEFEDYFQLFRESKDEKISPLCCPILIRDNAPFTRKEITAHLENNGIETRPMFSSIPTQQPAYKFLGYKEGDFPNAEKIGRNGFYIGCHQNLTDEDLEYIVNTIRNFYLI